MQLISKQKPRLLVEEQRQQISEIHATFFELIQFDEIDYIIGDMPPQILSQVHASQRKYKLKNKKQQLQGEDKWSLFIAQKCLVITQKAFDHLYCLLSKHLQFILTQNKITQFQLKCADILITMNGQNEQVWNIKKTILKNKQQQQLHLDIKHELDLNKAVLMKFKKTTACYQFRFQLMNSLLDKHLLQAKQDKLNIGSIEVLHENQTSIIRRVLGRFFRNYFCWMYRLRLIKYLFQQFIPQVMKQTKENNHKIEVLKLALTIYRKQISQAHWFIEQNPNDHSAIHYLIWLRLKKNQIWQNILSAIQQTNLFGQSDQLSFVVNIPLKKQLSTLLNNSVTQSELEWSFTFLQFCQTAYDSTSSYSQFQIYHDTHVFPKISQF